MRLIDHKVDCSMYMHSLLASVSKRIHSQNQSHIDLNTIGNNMIVEHSRTGLFILLAFGILIVGTVGNLELRFDRL